MARIVPHQTIWNTLQTDKLDDIYAALDIELDLELAPSCKSSFLRSRISFFEQDYSQG